MMTNMTRDVTTEPLTDVQQIPVGRGDVWSAYKATDQNGYDVVVIEMTNGKKLVVQASESLSVLVVQS